MGDKMQNGIENYGVPRVSPAATRRAARVEAACGRPWGKPPLSKGGGPKGRGDSAAFGRRVSF